jgi:hypothetical protein
MIEKKKDQKWDMYRKVEAQLCRYYPLDERPAPCRKMAVGGPMLRLAIRHGYRSWDFGRGGGAPLRIRQLAKFHLDGKIEQCEAFVDFAIADDDSSEERYCLWHVKSSDRWIGLLSPTYQALRKIRGEEIDRNKIAKAARRPKTPLRTLASRRDIL